MRRRPPRSTRTDTLFPYTTLVRTLASRHSPRNGRRVRGNPNSPTSTPPSVGAYDHLENVGMRVLVPRRDALRNHGATSHTHRSPRNVVQRRDGGDLVSCRTEERRVGTGGESRCRFRGWRIH